MDNAGTTYKDGGPAPATPMPAPVVPDMSGKNIVNILDGKVTETPGRTTR